MVVDTIEKWLDEDGINLRQYLSFETACDLAPVIATRRR
ncbi:Coenzyme F420-dependent N5,N10-methylene tetrahydromethanopterin reductase [Pseudomonas chlororaphis subsp. aurantiaca]|nr:Coenzyme F420-dependent N5,N10-methylene tetrahydromethanopterin reductase [Pseudomonas chlororaphis subsp. aurantiaca]AZD35900.1 Coenzyme F420-dependent N5,N10-methylene tetrahydromethanopterin reductase [Pseudomonas chlororaphis subsp. aurantiaca]AZD42237.1 Coenzyme F420-dependent N5,N10-methylene tetrahydromethanopterin reductase [Pseudomonas chlororaphis subsp. aurantiaca]